MKLAIAQMVLGVFILVTFIVTSEGGLYVYLVLGLGVLGCGFAQFLKACR